MQSTVTQTAVEEVLRTLRTSLFAGNLDRVRDVLDLHGEVLRKHDEFKNNSLSYALQSGIQSKKKRVELLEILIQAGADVNAVNTYGSTPLYMAVTYFKDECVDALILMGADVNKRSRTQSTSPLGAAVNASDLFMVEKLVKAGAVIGIEDRHILDTAERESNNRRRSERVRWAYRKISDELLKALER